jgi:hypothetical protein
METTALVVSEYLAYPLAVSSLACTVLAVRDTRVRWVLASVAFAVPAALARTQMLALPVILVVALVGDLVRQAPGTRLAWSQARPRALWGLLVAGVAGLLVVYVVDQRLTGYPILTFPVTFMHGLEATGRHAVTAINMFAFVPIVAAAALMARRAKWRDDSRIPAGPPRLVGVVQPPCPLGICLGALGSPCSCGRLARSRSRLAPRPLPIKSGSSEDSSGGFPRAVRRPCDYPLEAASRSWSCR